MKKGVELEYFTVDSEGKLVNNLDLADDIEFAAPEFAECIIEIKSDPHESIEELENDLREKIRTTIEEAKEEGMRLVPLGTPLNHEDIELIDSERLDMMKKFNPEDIEIEKNLARVGTHIHFEKDNVTDQINVLTALDPAFALLNTSPYHKGEPVASSSRNWVYRYSWEPKFPKSVKLWDYADSVDEWKERMHEAFDNFKKGAIDAGIDEEKFMNHHHPDRSTWTPVRLRDQFPTVEYRSPDTTVPSDVLRFVREMNDIMEKSRERDVTVGSEPGIHEDKIVLPPFERVKELSRQAAEKGLESEEVREYLEKMGFEPSSYEPLSREFEGEDKISIEEAREIRLQAADMLEKDVDAR